MLTKEKKHILFGSESEEVFFLTICLSPANYIYEFFNAGGLCPTADWITIGCPTYPAASIARYTISNIDTVM